MCALKTKHSNQNFISFLKMLKNYLFCLNPVCLGHFTLFWKKKLRRGNAIKLKQFFVKKSRLYKVMLMLTEPKKVFRAVIQMAHSKRTQS